MKKFMKQDNEELDDYLRRVYNLAPDVEILSVDVFLDKTILEGIEAETFDPERNMVYPNKDIDINKTLCIITVKDRNGKISHLNIKLGDEE